MAVHGTRTGWAGLHVFEDQLMTEEVGTLAWRNPKYNAVGTIDIEIEHPVWGWIPFTADPNDVELLGKALYDAAVEIGQVENYPPPPPEKVRAAMTDLTRKQFRLGLRDLGITSAMIDAALAAIPDEDRREIAQIEWEDSDRFQRLHPLIANLMAVFGKTDDEVDAAWTQAMSSPY
jgi:hypothetical protein